MTRALSRTLTGFDGLRKGLSDARRFGLSTVDDTGRMNEKRVDEKRMDERRMDERRVAKDAWTREAWRGP